LRRKHWEGQHAEISHKLVCNPGGGDHQAGCWCLGSVTFEKRPLQLYMINNAYLLLALLLMGAVLAVWP
jgi:hypothetical protein